MEYDNLSETLRMFPHWYDKNPDSNFTKTIRVLNRQYLDKYHKIKALDYAKRLLKPIRIYKEQDNDYEYSIIADVEMENLKRVNFYINPKVNEKEEIISYEKVFTKDFKDDGTNDNYNFRYDGDTRKVWVNGEYIGGFNVNVEAVDVNGEPLEANVSWNPSPVMPKDSFLLEVLTYDDYRWLKGFPENDDEDLYRIYREEKSYTQYLTFEVNKKNIKDITVLKDNNIIYFTDLFSKTNADDKVIYHDYQQTQEIIKEYSNVKVADPNKDQYIIRVILNNDDYQPVFDLKPLETLQPDIDRWEYVQSYPEPGDYGVIIRERNTYNAYKPDNDGGWEQCFYNVPYTLELKHNYDLIITLYDKNNPNCTHLYRTIHKRYNGYDKTRYDCFTHDFSLDILGKYWNIPRLELLPYERETQCGEHTHFKSTYPPYNDRTTEDDYHYQQRINTYIQNYNKTLFPILEIWKSYQVWGTLRNRKDILSVQDHSYMADNAYYEDTRIIEESLNKLEIIEGEGTPVNIGSRSWYETILADGLFLVPLGEYRFHCNIKTDQPFNNQRITLHLYYLDKKGNCVSEEAHTLNLTEYEVNTYNIDSNIIIKSDAYKVDIVLESDINYTLSNAYLKRLTIADKTAMYMATKKDYNSCVYDLTIKAADVPSNINFGDTGTFEKLLQKSMPLTHKCFLKTEYDYREETGITDGFGELHVENYFNDETDHDQNSNEYLKQLPSLVMEEAEYRIDVEFRMEEWSENESYIHTRIDFKENVNDDEPISSIEMESVVMADYWTRLSEAFTTPNGTQAIDITFQSETLRFKYKGLCVERITPVTEDELWI